MRNKSSLLLLPIFSFGLKLVQISVLSLNFSTRADGKPRRKFHVSRVIHSFQVEHSHGIKSLP